MRSKEFLKNNKPPWFTGLLTAVLLGIIAWLWQGVHARLERIDDKLRQVELNQTKILTVLRIEPAAVSQTRPPAADLRAKPEPAYSSAEPSAD